MSKAHACIVIDIGGHAIRAVSVDTSGSIIDSIYAEYATQEEHADRVEHRAEEMIQAMQSVLTDMHRQLVTQGFSVSRVGLATQRSTIVCWNKRDFSALSPVISWRDTRARSFLDKFKSQQRRIHDRTGLVLSAHYGVSKMRWCLDNLAQVKAALSQNELMLGPLAAYCVVHLLQNHRALVDTANAQRTLLCNLDNGQWDPELLELFSIDAQTLPAIVDTLHNYGSLALMPELGLYCVIGDQSAFLYSSGFPDLDALYLNMGTGAFMLRPIPEGYSITVDQLLYTIVAMSGNKMSYAAEGTVNGAGAALQWIKDTEALTTLPGYAELSGDENISQTKAIFLNGISGLGAPFWIADFKSEFIHADSLNERVFAVYESILFLLFYNYQYLIEKSNSQLGVQRIRVSGGLSADDVYCQALANLFCLPVVRYRETEATALGAAFLTLDSPASWSKSDPENSYQPAENRALRKRYQNWCDEMQKRI